MHSALVYIMINFQVIFLVDSAKQCSKDSENLVTLEKETEVVASLTKEKVSFFHS